ncbi:MAG: hypothetical protein JNJ54_09930 [Myxococcaceae bacterium]|nr:hypothetical protein [Myxococcaceae bacterium]
MSGSSRAGRTLSRCVVTLDAGISISWAPDPDGSYDHGMRHHQREEDEFRQRIDRATPAIEVRFDALESEGHAFVVPSDPAFRHRAQRGTSSGLPSLELELACTPVLTDEALAALTADVAKLVVETEPAARPAPPPTPPRVAQPPRPWWRFW